jgi:hypothetical protein
MTVLGGTAAGRSHITDAPGRVPTQIAGQPTGLIDGEV